MSLKYILVFDNHESHCIGKDKAIAAFAAALHRGAANMTMTVSDVSPPIEGAAALHHIRRGCCDGTDPVACYQRMTDKACEEAAEQAAARRAARSPKPWDEFDGTEA